MNTFFVFLGILLLSQFVSLLAALQLADYFPATEVFIGVPIPVAIITLVIFGVAYAMARSPRAFNWLAILLAIVVVALVTLLAMLDWLTGRSAVPLDTSEESIQVTLEMLVPALVLILVQWGLVRRRWLRTRGEDDLTRWPWVTTVVAGLVILNPLGLSVVSAAVKFSITDWLRDLWLTITLAGAAVLMVLAVIEFYVRGRALRRRLAVNT